jgi:Flp pilus assembly protein TadD
METGRLHITGAASPVGAPVLFRDGGLVDARHLDLVDLALREGRLRFERTDVDGVGDHRALGSYLVESCRDPSAAGFAAQHTFDAPLLKAMRRPLSELPVSRDTRAVLGKADGRQTLGRLLAMLGVPAESVDADLACLRRLGLLTLSAPRARRTGVSRPGASASVTPQGSPGAGLSRSSGPATFGAEVHSDTTTRHVGAGPEPDSTPTSVTRSSVSSARRRRRRERSTTRTEPVSTRRRRMPRMQPAVLEKQLERELSRLEGASPAMVLGVPPDSGTSLVKGVAARQRQRYQRIADDVRGQARVRELAARLLELVAHAEEKWGHSDRALSGTTDSPRELVWLEQGRALIDAGDFPRADRVLSRARDLTIANPDILAWLGVARLGNPEHSEEERQSEGLDLLLLAEQFNPEHLTAVSWLARTYARSGQHDRALPRARRWARLAPEDSEASGLLAELQRQKGETKG